MKKLLGLGVFLGFIVAIGCGETRQPDELKVVSKAVESTCQESDLSKPDGVCEGPWEYSAHSSPCDKDPTGPGCTVLRDTQGNTCYTYNTCEHPSFGLYSVSSHDGVRLIGHNNWPGGGAEKRWMWKYGSGNSCTGGLEVMPDKVYPTSTTLESFCRSLADDERDWWASRTPTAHVAVVSSSVSPEPSCTGQVNSSGTDYTTYWHECETKVVENRYKSGTASFCGCQYVAKKYSAFGATRASLDSDPLALTSTHTPTCLTADNIQEPQAKFAVLHSSLQTLGSGGYAQLDTGKLRPLLVGKLKLLLELHGEKLTAEQRGVIRDLYLQNDYEPICGTQWAPESPPPGECGDWTTPGAMTLCDRLAQAHVSPASAAASAGLCLDARQSFQSAPTCTDRTYLDKYVTTAPTVLTKAFSKLMATDSAVRKTTLQERLGLIQRWYDGVKTDGYTGSGFTKADLWRDVSAVTDALELGVYSNSIAAVDPSIAGASVINNAEHLRLGYAADRELLTAMFTDVPTTTSPPLTGAPALYVLADAFRPMSTRLGEVDYLHDLGCRFKNCTGTFTSEVRQTHALLGSMANSTALAEVYKSQSNLVRKEWRDVFAQLVARYDAVVKRAVIDAIGKYSPDEIHNATIDQPAVYAFAEIVNASRTKSGSFARTGRFRQTSSDALLTGLTQAKLNTVISDTTTAVQSLAAKRTEYVNTRTQLLTEHIGYMNGVGAELNVLKALETKGKVVDQLLADLEGYRVAATVDKERFGDMGIAYDNAIRRLENNWNGEFVTRDPDGPFDLSPADPEVVKWSGGPITDISLIAARGPYHAKNGDLLRITAEGTWAPTCALKKGAARATPPLSVPDNPMTTTQGYHVESSSSRYEAKGRTEDDFKSWSRGHTLCAGGAVSVSLVVVSLPIGSAQYCWSETTGGQKSDTTSNGTEYRTSAAFNSGLHLDTAPFPQYPVGALLAVRMRAGQTSPSNIIDVEVVQTPNTTLLVSQPHTELPSAPPVESDIYLVVNELSAQDCARGNPGKVTLNVEHMQPKARFARHLQTAMAKTYASLQRTIAQTILPQGAVLSGQIQALENEAMSNLTAECSKDMPCDLATYDRDLVQLYRTWVLQALAQAERQVMINKLEQQLLIAAMEWEAMAADLVQRKRVTQLSALLPVWTIRNLDLDHMKNSTQTLAHLVDTTLYPFIKVKYPEALHGKKDVLTGLDNDSYAQAQFTALSSGLDWTADWDVLAARAISAVLAIQDELNRAHERMLKSTERLGYTVALAFKKPAAYISPQLPQPDPEQSWFDTNYSSRYREASDERAARLWSALEANQAVPFEILPEDLYQFARAVDSTGNELPKPDLQLLCSWTVPVIRGMGIVIANDGNSTNGSLNNQNRTVQSWASPNQSYVGAAHLENVVMKNDAWLNLGIPVSYSRIEDVNTIFWSRTPANSDVPPPAERAAGEGLSPVGSYTIDPGYLPWLDPILEKDGLQHSTAFVVMLNLEFRDKGDSPTWLTNCKR